METLGVITRNQQNVYTLSKTIIYERKAETQEHDWEKTTELIDFNARGQYIGNNGSIYQMTAEYADNATKISPTVQVTVINETGDVNKYYIDISKVDTSNATEIEMFALCSHADTKRGRYGDIADGTLSSWESLLFYQEMAIQKGYAGQNNFNNILKMPAYNWRDMISDIAETYMEEGVYDHYLHVNRMKDMLDYYSHFEGRPDAFEDTFHAIRDYEFIRVLSLEGSVNIEIYDKQKKIVCSDISLEFGSNELWSRKLTDEELQKAIEIAGKPHKVYMKDYSFWDEILSGKYQMEDYDTYIQELKRQCQNDNMFVNCPFQVKEAWKYAEKKTGFNGLGVSKGNNIEVKFISEYMRMQMEQMRKGEEVNLLGTTIESAIDLAKQIIKRLDEIDFSQMTEEDRKIKLRERAFYGYFLECLDPTQKYNPIKLLLNE